MPDFDHIRAEIGHMRVQVYRQRGEIRQLQRAGIPTASAEALLDRMAIIVSIDQYAEAALGNREFFLNKP